MTTVLRENVHVFGGECWDRASGDSMALPQVVCFWEMGWNKTRQLTSWPSFLLPFLSPSLPSSVMFRGWCMPWLSSEQARGYTVSESTGGDRCINQYWQYNRGSAGLKPYPQRMPLPCTFTLLVSYLQAATQSHSLSQVTWVLSRGPEVQMAKTRLIIILRECAVACWQLMPSLAVLNQLSYALG